MTIGTVKFFNPAKKFGFITPDGDGKDLYFPSSAAPAADIARLTTGRRVSFDRESDPRGEKAANLKLLDEMLAPMPTVSVPAAPVARQTITIYCDPAAPESQIVEAALRAKGHEPIVIDYAATPFTVDQLKRLAGLLGGQSLVRRYHPMFLDLQLDDRFIGEAEYWTAVAEHPVLINGPVVVAGARAALCVSPKDVASLFESTPVVEAERKPKQISARLAAMMTGQPVGPRPKATAAAPISAPESPSPAAHQPVSRPATVKAEPAGKPPAAKIITLKKAAPAKALPKAASKPVAPAKKAAKPAAAKKPSPVAKPSPKKKK